MLNVTYGLGCDSAEDPMLNRLEKLVTAVIHGAVFLVVRLLFAYAHE
jgi:hypothetical protein